MLAVHGDAEFSVAGLTDDGDLRVPGEDGVQGHAGEEMILDEEDTDLLHIPIQRIRCCS